VIALVDTNVVLDVLLGRKAHLPSSAAVLASVEAGHCQGLLCATTLTTVHYIAQRHLGREASLDKLRKLLSLFRIAAVTHGVLDSALNRRMGDYEDAVLHEAALHAGASCIVTRNVHDFAAATVPVYTPDQFLAALASPS
jgi:predicted nucleic acid-binding protein